MFENRSDEISNLIDEEGLDLKFKIRDKLLPLNFDCTPSISYDYLLLNRNNEFSFHNPEFNKATSEEFPFLSDSQIYFQRIQEICKSNFRELTDLTTYFTVINPNRNFKRIVDFIFTQSLQAEQIPPFIEIKLYANKNGSKAPRVFGFVGNANIIYILFYDPFHQIYDKKVRFKQPANNTEVQNYPLDGN